MKFQFLLLVAFAGLSASVGQNAAADINNRIEVDEEASDSEATTASNQGILSEAEVENRFPKLDEKASQSSLERPTNLKVVAASQRSISLRWDFSPASGNIDGYRIYYVHENFPDVKTILKATPAYDLHGLGNGVCLSVINKQFV
jgi:hypothetical protein